MCHLQQLINVNINMIFVYAMWRTKVLQDKVSLTTTLVNSRHMRRHQRETLQPPNTQTDTDLSILQYVVY